MSLETDTKDTKIDAPSASDQEVEPQETTEESQELVPADTVVKVKHKYKAQARTAQEEQKKAEEEYQRELEALRNENALFKTALGGNSEPDKLTRPRQYDYDTDEEYDAAMDAYEIKRDEIRFSELRKKEQQEAEQARKQREQAEYQAELERKSQISIERYQESASDLGDPDFAETESALLEVIGEDMHMHILNAMPERSALVTRALGKDPARAKELLEEAAKDPVAAMINLGIYAASIGEVQSDPAIEADEPVKGGLASSLSGWDKKIEEMRDKARKGIATHNEVIALKRKAKADGWVEQ